MYAPGAASVYGPSLWQATQTGRFPFRSINHIGCVGPQMLHLRRMVFRAEKTREAPMLVYVAVCVAAHFLPLAGLITPHIALYSD